MSDTTKGAAADVRPAPPAYMANSNIPNQHDTIQEAPACVPVSAPMSQTLHKIYNRCFYLNIVRCLIGAVVVGLAADILASKPKQDAKIFAAVAVAVGAINIPSVIKMRPRSPTDARLPQWFQLLNGLYALAWVAVMGTAFNQCVNGDNDPAVDQPDTLPTGYYGDGYTRLAKRRVIVIGGGGFDLFETKIAKLFVAIGALAVINFIFALCLSLQGSRMSRVHITPSEIEALYYQRTRQRGSKHQPLPTATPEVSQVYSVNAVKRMRANVAQDDPSGRLRRKAVDIAGCPLFGVTCVPLF
ncbi:hypothetical protein NLG97_g3526 [Lecanicillium saksenae]|uniref:Uncharacterized protein n=1 Tax=Lecanicillium saksenae TaxID=468837 RepID=A0ACC1QXU7_9HYPO|nr:hypothetical protein NLG97_g3526 [Lecanicillium saksenae]